MLFMWIQILNPRKTGNILRPVLNETFANTFEKVHDLFRLIAGQHFKIVRLLRCNGRVIKKSRCGKFAIERTTSTRIIS